MRRVAHWVFKSLSDRRWAALGGAFVAALLSGAPAAAQDAMDGALGAAPLDGTLLAQSAAERDEFSGLRAAARRREAELRRRAAGETGAARSASSSRASSSRTAAPRLAPKPPLAAPVPRLRPDRDAQTVVDTPETAAAIVTAPTPSQGPSDIGRLVPSPPLLPIPASNRSQPPSQPTSQPQPTSQVSADPLVEPAAASASLNPAPVPAPEPVVAPEPPRTVARVSAAPAEASAGFLSDPTIRIGLAFIVGLGLLALAFLRERATSGGNGAA